VTAGPTDGGRPRRSVAAGLPAIRPVGLGHEAALFAGETAGGPTGFGRHPGREQVPQPAAVTAGKEIADWGGTQRRCQHGAGGAVGDFRPCHAAVGLGRQARRGADQRRKRRGAHHLGAVHRRRVAPGQVVEQACVRLRHDDDGKQENGQSPASSGPFAVVRWASWRAGQKDRPSAAHAAFDQ